MTKSRFFLLQIALLVTLTATPASLGQSADPNSGNPDSNIIPRALPVEKTKTRKPNLLERIFKKPTPTPFPTPEVTATPEKPRYPRKRSKNRAATPTPTPTPSDESAGETPSPTPAAAKAKTASASPKPTPKPTTAPTPQPGLEPLPEPLAIESPTGALPDSTPLPNSLPPLVGGSVSNSATDPSEPPAATPKQTTAANFRAPAPVPTSTPIPADVLNNPLNQPIPLVNDGMALQINPDSVTPEANLERETVDRIQFRKVKARALEDGKLQELKQKADLAATPAERFAALKVFYPQLFTSMRKIDESLSFQIDEMEAASRRRLERMEADGLDSDSSTN